MALYEMVGSGRFASEALIRQVILWEVSLAALAAFGFVLADKLTPDPLPEANESDAVAAWKKYREENPIDLGPE